MTKLSLSSMVVFFLITLTFIWYPVFDAYCADNKDVSEASKLLQLARENMSAGNLDASIEYLNKAISLDDKNSYAYVGLGNAYTQKNEPDKAVEYFNKAISLDDKNSYAYVGLGNAYTQKNEPDKAVEYFNKAISLDSKNPFAYFNLGLSYLSLNKREDALKMYNILKDLDGSLADKLKQQMQLSDESK